MLLDIKNHIEELVDVGFPRRLAVQMAREEYLKRAQVLAKQKKPKDDRKR